MPKSFAQELNGLVARAGMVDFEPCVSSYAHDACSVLVPLTQIQSPLARTVLDAERALKILAGIRAGDALPPVEVDVPPQAVAALRYRLKDGFHRYHLSSVLGFTHIPVVVQEYFEFEL